MNFKSKAVGVAFRVLASVAVVGSTTLLAGTAMAALTNADQAAVAPLATSIAEAVRAAVAANVGADAATVEAAVAAAVAGAIASADPEVANLALARAATALTNDGTMVGLGVSAAFEAAQQTALANAIVAAAGEAAAAGDDPAAAILETVDASGVSQSVAQAAMLSASANFFVSNPALASQLGGLADTVATGDRATVTSAGYLQVGGDLGGNNNYNA